MAWIRTISDDEAEGLLKSEFETARRRAGKVYGIVRLMSLDPVILKTSMGFYGATTTSPRSPLSRWFRELVAVTVSRLNECFY